MPRRGFFAELQYQSRLLAREHERAQREAARNHAAAIRAAERAKSAALRIRAELDRAAEAERKRLEKEARNAHVAAKEAEVLEQNGNLQQIYDDIDSLLAATLAVDDHVDLKSLRIVVKHPPFDRSDLEVPIPPPKLLLDPKEPVLELPEPPAGILGLFGKKKHTEAVENARQRHESALSEWRSACKEAAARRQATIESHARDEARRLDALRTERERYAKECSAREAEAAEHNRNLVELIRSLGYGTVEAVQEYVSIVLSNSVYPEHFSVSHEFEFDPLTAELRLKALVPGPSAIPVIKAYKYAKSADKIISTSLSQKESRERYAGAIHQVALRSFHEVFESDRRGLIRTISLEVGTNGIDPATGRPTYVPFVVAAAEREPFSELDLSAVVPALTLARLGAAVSKNPYGLIAANGSGVRRS